MTASWQEQLEELQALRSIFENDLVVPGYDGDSSSSDLDEWLAGLADSQTLLDIFEPQLLVHFITAATPMTVKVHPRLAIRRSDQNHWPAVESGL